VSVTIVIVDDHPIIRDGLCSLLSQYEDMQVVGTSEGGNAALRLIKILDPDIILMDIVLVGQNGLGLTRQLRAQGCRSRVIALTSFDSKDYIRDALQVGIQGYLLKSAAAERLAGVIRGVHKGEVHICTTQASDVLCNQQALGTVSQRPDIEFREEEMQLLHLIAEGASTEVMAGDFQISERTIKRRIRNIREKLGANTRAEIIAKAHELGLL